MTSFAYAQSGFEGEVDTMADSVKEILVGPVSKIIGGFLVIAAVFMLVGRNWAQAVGFLLGAVLLLKLSDLMLLFGGN